jgi:acyl carrier protein
LSPSIPHDLAHATSSVRAIVVARVSRLSDHEALDDVPFGVEGLGLDSIAIAEVLLECERHFSIRLTDLLDGPPITVGRIAARVMKTPSP